MNLKLITHLSNHLNTTFACLLMSLSLCIIHQRQSFLSAPCKSILWEPCVQSLKDLKREFLQKKERYEHLPSVSEMKEVLENLKKTMVWCLVRWVHRRVKQINGRNYLFFFFFFHPMYYKFCILSLSGQREGAAGAAVEGRCWKGSE